MKVEDLEVTVVAGGEVRKLPLREIVNPEDIKNLESIVKAEVDKARVDLVHSFIREFTNDHDPTKPPRWLRSVALDEQHLLDQILEFFERELQSSVDTGKDVE